MKKILRFWLSVSIVVNGQYGLAHAQMLARAGNQVNKTTHAPDHYSLRTVLTGFKNKYRVNILFENRVVEKLSVPATSLPAAETVENALEKVLTPFGLAYKKVKDRSYIIVTNRPDAKTVSINPIPVAPASLPTGTPETPGALSMIAPSTTVSQQPKDQAVRGTVRDGSNNQALPGVSVVVKGTQRGATTDANGNFRVDVPDQNAVLIFSFIGFETREVLVGTQSVLNLDLTPTDQSLNEVVVVGYGTQRKESLTGAISGITSKDLDRVHTTTVSAALAGKIPGVSFRMADGRPGSSANIQIRNLGNPLFVIDGIQKDAGQFNNISPNDIESITVLKDASASVYGSRAANGVVIVTTKRGKSGSRNTVNIDSYYGWQNWARFPETVNAYEWMTGKADADINQTGRTNITPEELEKWRAGTEKGYQSFDWYKFIIKPNSPQYSLNVNATGGSDKITYYLSATRLFQNSVLGREFTFGRTNIQSNVDAQISNRLKVGVQINGRIESRDNPGVPGVDDYWGPRFALFRNRPTERPFANDNPAYLNDIGHNDTNWGLLNKEKSGYWTEDWRVLQTNFNAEYQLPIKGLTAKGMYSYYFADRLVNGHEYTYDAYTYNAQTDQYVRTGGSSNPWRERRTEKIMEQVLQGQLSYNNTFGKHTVGGTFVAERIQRRRLYTFQHAVPKTNVLPVLQFADMDAQDFADVDEDQARVGYVGRFTYDYGGRYLLELAGRQDASWKFAPGKRWGFFPSVSAGWRITEENFFKGLNWNALSEVKLRASYGELGDDDIGIGAYDYIPGYNYGSSTVILDGNVIKGSRDRGVPITNISWFTSKMTDVGLDYALYNGRLSGTFDYFYRKRSGLRGRKYDVLVPNELGYSLPDENVNSDAQVGGEASLSYNGKVKELTFSVGGNVSYSRSRFLQSYRPTWGNSWDHYRTSQENRWSGTYWGYEVVGQFQSQQQINEYPVNIDGQGNKTLLPGDLIYNDVNGDGRIDGYDERPIGYARDRNPAVNFGLNLSAAYKGFDLKVDFSGGTMYSYNQGWEMRWPYQNTGNLLAQFYDDRWHRADIFNPDSEWIPGKYPALRFNDGGHSNYNRNSTFWLTNVRYMRLRTMEVGYSLPKAWLERVKIQRARFYVNTFNLLSFDNVRRLGVEPEVMDENGLQYPQNKFVNVGLNLSF